MSPTRLWKQLNFKKQSPLAWLFIAILVCANLATFSFLWNLLSSQGNAAVPHALPRASSSGLDLWPESTLTPEPTTTATRVVVYVSTSTKTPTPLPSPTPTLTPLPSATPTAPVVPTPTVPARPEIQYVVIISIDGLRPDALDLTHTPTLDSLRIKGTYAPNAQTVRLSETLPSHASMLSGMTPDKHGIQWGVPYIGWPGIKGPTLFSLAHQAGLSTGMVFGKEKMHHLIIPNSVDKLFGADVHDKEVKKQAIEMIEAGLPQVFFIHFPDTDRIGHTYGWLSINQLQSITFVDGLIGEIVAALEREGYLGSTFLLITADHGGHDRVHGDDSPEDRTIPWLAVGPDVPAGVTFTRLINTYDTAATAANALGLPIPENWDGQPVDLGSGAGN